MNLHQKVVHIEDFQKRYFNPGEVKQIITGDGNETILRKEIFQNTPFYVRILAALSLVMYLAGLAMICFGWCIFENKVHWGIAVVVTLLLTPCWRHVVNFGRSHQKFFALAITKSRILCAILPKYEGKIYTTHQFVKEQPISSLGNIGERYNNYEETRKRVEAGYIDDFVAGAEVYLTSRYATIKTSKRYIVLRSEENEIFIPYNKSALEFLELVVLVNN